jgi:hypothetical protein
VVTYPSTVHMSITFHHAVVVLKLCFYLTCYFYRPWECFGKFAVPSKLDVTISVSSCPGTVMGKSLLSIIQPLWWPLRSALAPIDTQGQSSLVMWMSLARLVLHLAVTPTT